MSKLSVNVDHVATLRQARGIVSYPDPIEAARIAEDAGADDVLLVPTTSDPDDVHRVADILS